MGGRRPLERGASPPGQDGPGPRRRGSPQLPQVFSKRIELQPVRDHGTRSRAVTPRQCGTRQQRRHADELAGQPGAADELPSLVFGVASGLGAASGSSLACCL